MEWYKVCFGATKDNQQFNVEANSTFETEEMFWKTDYYHW